MTAPASPTTGFITQPLRDLNAWASQFDTATLPVLDGTALVIEELRAVEDDVDAHQLADSLNSDPLMTLKLLAHVGQIRRPGGSESDRRGEVETVTEALVLLGIGPFFRGFGLQTGIGQALDGHPLALQGLEAALRRAQRAAAFAIGFAAHRLDHDASVIHEAALLHDFAEWLVWLRAPDLALRIVERQAEDAQLRSVKAQREVLGVSLSDLQQLLMKRWRLPSLLTRISNDHESSDIQVRNVQLAVRLARHTAHGWDNAAVPDDLVEIGQLLQLGEFPTRKLVLDIDADFL